MNEHLEMQLIACLDALDAGEPIDQILARYPEDAAALRPLLQTAATLGDMAEEPAPAAQAASRRRFLNRAYELRVSGGPLRGLLGARLGAALAGALVVLFTFGGAVASSAAALPGDALYGVKRTVEDVRLAVAPDRSSLARDLEQERRAEVIELLDAGRSAPVTFAGQIERLGAGTWRVGGVEVSVAGAQITGEPALGSRATIAGRVASGRVSADTIGIEPTDATVPPTPTPTATSAPTATRVPTATPTPTATSAPTRTPEPTATPVPTSTPIPTSPPPTRIPATAVPPPTAAPAPTAGDDNANENGDDNANENGDDGANDNGDDNANENGDDGSNDNGDDSGGSGGGDDSSNDNGDDSGGSGGGDDSSNDNGDDSSNDNGDDSSNDNGDDSGGSGGSGGGDDNDSEDDN